jgi:Antibiotic biosynthesis monooxygenase
VLVITRYRVPEPETESFVATAHDALRVLAGTPGHVSGRLGRAADDPELWAMVTDWDGAGYYRRALGEYAVWEALIPLSARAVDEPGAYEIVDPAER